MQNLKYLYIIIFYTFISCAQKYELTTKDIKFLNKAVDSIYELDTKNRSLLTLNDSIYGLGANAFGISESKKIEMLGVEYEEYKSKQDSIWKVIKKADNSNTQYLLKIIKEYGFPSNKRLGVYKSKAYWILVHSPSRYFDEINQIITKEYNAKRISEYKKEYIFWHTKGRKGMPPMSGENGEAIFQ